MEPKHKIQYDDEDKMTDDDDTDDATAEIMNIEKRIKKKKLARQKSQQSAIDIVVENASQDVIASETIKTENSKKNDSDSEFEDSINDDLRPDVIKGSMKRTKQSETTFNSWHDLDFPQDKVELPKSYFTDGPTPWSNFSDLVLGTFEIKKRSWISNLKLQVRGF